VPIFSGLVTFSCSALGGWASGAAVAVAVAAAAVRRWGVAAVGGVLVAVGSF